MKIHSPKHLLISLIEVQRGIGEIEMNWRDFLQSMNQLQRMNDFLLQAKCEKNVVENQVEIQFQSTVKRQ